jgi:hypothetical protein
MHDALTKIFITRFENDYKFYGGIEIGMNFRGKCEDKPGIIRSFTGGFLSSASSSSRNWEKQILN